MTNDRLNSLSLEDYPERMTPRKRLIMIVVIACMFFPFVFSMILTSLAGGLLNQAGTWAGVTLILAVAVGWHFHRAARKSELEESTQWILAFGGGMGVIAISIVLALMISWWTTTHIAFQNESGELLDLMVVAEEQLLIRENVASGEVVPFALQSWRDQVTLHVNLYYRDSELTTLTLIRSDFPDRTALEIEPKGVVTFSAAGQSKQFYQPLLEQTADDLEKLLQ